MPATDPAAYDLYLTARQHAASELLSEDAERLYRRAIEIDGDLQLSYFWLGNALYHRGDLKEAAEVFGELLARLALQGVKYLRDFQLAFTGWVGLV